MLKLKLQYFGHLMGRVDSLEKTLMLGGIGGRRRRGQQSMRWLDGTTNWMDMSLSEPRELVMDRAAWRAAIHGVSKGRTRLSDWTDLTLLTPRFGVGIKSVDAAMCLTSVRCDNKGGANGLFFFLNYKEALEGGKFTYYSKKSTYLMWSLSNYPWHFSQNQNLEF